jgi:hypothetical protein|tara:strand:- start:6222 stop:6824 length:603 start_codon:yes stop_codon:yes gene_type:complete
MCFDNQVKIKFSDPSAQLLLYPLVSQFNFLTPDQVKIISSAISSSKSLKSISLCDCNCITAIQISSLITTLSNSNHLAELYLNNLRINNEAATCLATLINNCPLEKLSITSINCSVKDFKIVIESLKENKTIESLILGDITISKIVALNDALSHNTTITNLKYNLSDTSTNIPSNYDKTASQIVSKINRNIEEKIEKQLE